MVLIYENEPLDHEKAGGHWYHVCLGRVETTALGVPPQDKPYECPRCGVELEVDDFWYAQMKGSV
ncbi:MAG: hypothetical protein U0172_04110 [Nitrospiraceae bacterium]